MLTEKDLDIYDVWESPNGNLFIKLTNKYSLPIGNKQNHDPGDYIKTQYVKCDNITPCKKVGKLIFD